MHGIYSDTGQQLQRPWWQHNDEGILLTKQTTILIADIVGPGSCDELARLMKMSVQDQAVRVSQYRKLNEARTLVVAEYSGPTPQIAKANFSRDESPFTVDIISATEIVSRQRDDAIGDLREAPLLYTVTFPVPLEREAALASWYDEEHVGILQGCPFWPMTRRFHIDDAPSRWGRHLALHYLTDIRALRSPERTAARNTPWRAELESEAWFRGTYTVYLQEE